MWESSRSESTDVLHLKGFEFNSTAGKTESFKPTLGEDNKEALKTPGRYQNWPTNKKQAMGAA